MKETENGKTFSVGKEGTTEWRVGEADKQRKGSSMGSVGRRTMDQNSSSVAPEKPNKWKLEHRNSCSSLSIPQGLGAQRCKSLCLVTPRLGSSGPGLLCRCPWSL